MPSLWQPALCWFSGWTRPHQFSGAFLVQAKLPGWRCPLIFDPFRFSTCRGSPECFWIQPGGGAHRCSAWWPWPRVPACWAAPRTRRWPDGRGWGVWWAWPHGGSGKTPKRGKDSWRRPLEWRYSGGKKNMVLARNKPRRNSGRLVARRCCI